MNASMRLYSCLQFIPAVTNCFELERYLMGYLVIRRVTVFLHSPEFTPPSVPRSPPRNLQVSEEWYNRFRISWNHPDTTPVGYRVVYQPLTGR